MATDTAAPIPLDPTRNLWQVPVLLLGLCAFAAVWRGWVPLGSADPGTGFARDLDALRECYERKRPDPLELKNHLNRVAANVDAHPTAAAGARFRLGSGYSRLAELTPAADEAASYWALALQHFQLVTEKQLRDPADVTRFVFRSAKARAAIGLPPGTKNEELVLLATVLSAPPANEEAGETHRLIADLALRGTPPDLIRAKLELTEYLTGTGPATPSTALARARLRLGDLHLRAGEYDQARRWLKEIDADAPPEVLGPAKAELAQVLMAESNWVAAGKELEQLRAAPGVPAPLRAAAAYHLGLCKVRLKEHDAALKLFEEAVKAADPEATAAALRLADLHVRSADAARHKAGADLLAAALRDVRDPSRYDAALVPLDEVRGTCETAVAALLADGAFEAALSAAGWYAGVAAPPRDRELRAEILGAWGAALTKERKPEAKAQHKAASAEWAQLAAGREKGERVALLQKAAAHARLADDPSSAATHLQAALKVDGAPETEQGPLWAELAEALLAANRPDEVWKAFNNAMASVGAVSTQTRYRLAQQFGESRHPGFAPLGRQLLEQIAKQENVSAAEREFHERALCELGYALLREGNPADAEARLRAQLTMYANGPEAGKARLFLGMALLQRAAGRPAPPDAPKLRADALAAFRQVVKEADEFERKNGKLNEPQAWLRLQAGLRVLQAHQQMGQPREVLFDAAPLLDRYKDSVDELIVLSLVYHAFKQMNDAGRATDTFERMKELFNRLPPTAFPKKTGEYSRDFWQKTWFAPPEKK
jgi:tetratricopeptide (TPR) repeat protein